MPLEYMTIPSPVSFFLFSSVTTSYFENLHSLWPASINFYPFASSLFSTLNCLFFLTKFVVLDFSTLG